jgi:broad specificity phosphatase PhoE
MSETLPAVYLARHDETPWTVTGQHTGPTDFRFPARGAQCSATGEAS